MRATQFVRRGLIAFAAVAALSTGFAGMASAQYLGSSPGATIDGDDAIVFAPVPGYDYQVVHTPDGERSSLLLIGGPAADNPVAVQFLPDIDGAAVINPAGDDTIAARQ